MPFAPHLLTSQPACDPSTCGVLSVRELQSLRGVAPTETKYRPIFFAQFESDFGAEEWVTVRNLIRRDRDGAGDRRLPRLHVVGRLLLRCMGEVLVDDSDGIAWHG